MVAIKISILATPGFAGETSGGWIQETTEVDNYEERQVDVESRWSLVDDGKPPSWGEGREPSFNAEFQNFGHQKVSCSFVGGQIDTFKKNACWTWSNEEHMILQQFFLGCFGGKWVNFWDIHNIEFHRHFHISESSLRRKNKKQATKARWQSMPWGDTKRP